MSSNSASICHTFGHLLVEYLFGKQTRAYTRFKHTLSITHTEVSITNICRVAWRDRSKDLNCSTYAWGETSGQTANADAIGYNSHVQRRRRRNDRHIGRCSLETSVALNAISMWGSSSSRIEWILKELFCAVKYSSFFLERFLRTRFKCTTRR